MICLSKPMVRPACPNFSSGPTAKRPGWSLEALSSFVLGRSHRSKLGEAKLSQAIALTRELLCVPDGYAIGIVPASDTGAVEMALWSLLGERGVDVLAWESFGSDWVYDVCNQLKLPDVRVFDAPYGKLPDLSSLDFDRDIVFVWNGTTSGVRLPNSAFIPQDRKGLTICDATSAIFSEKMNFEALDVVTFSWQKCLGGEGGHGVLILSPRAFERLETWVPSWPIPKIFRLTSSGKVIKDIFKGKTINTPSMLCVEDYVDALNWAKQLGGLDALIRRVDSNFSVLDSFLSSSLWLANLASDPATRSRTSVCFSIIDPDVLSLDQTAQSAFAKNIAARLEQEGVAYDINAYRDAPPGLRVWCGPTVEKSDIEALLPWLDWSFAIEKKSVFKL